MKKRYKGCSEQYIKTFKQIYFNHQEQCVKEFTYRVGIVKDTEGYVYRLMNFDSLSIWKKYRFKTFEEAKHFIDNHPHNLERQQEKENNE